MRSFRIAAQLRVGDLVEARESAIAMQREHPLWGEALNALARIQLVEGRPQEVLDGLASVLSGDAPTIHEFTTTESHVLAARAWADLGYRRASEAAIEDALDLAERDRLVLPFVMADGAELLARHPRHGTKHGRLLTQIREILGGRLAGRIRCDAASRSAQS